MEELNTKTSWNKKKILIAAILLILLIVGGYFLKIRVLDTNLAQLTKSVKGIAVQEKNTDSKFKLDVPAAIKEKINSLKQDVSDLDIVEIASSSPQMQKIINDIKALEQYPQSQIKELCKKVCGL